MVTKRVYISKTDLKLFRFDRASKEVLFMYT